MIYKLAVLWAEYYIKKKNVKEEDKEIYIYCFDILISTILNFVILLVLAVVFKLYIETILFSISFMLFRGKCGGFHAKSHWGCLLTLIIVYGGMVALIKTVDPQIIRFISICISVVSILLAIIFAPVDNINRPFDKSERLLFRKQSLLRVTILLFISMILNLSVKTALYGFAISYAVFMVAVALPVGKIKNIIDIASEEKQPKIKETEI